MLQPNDILKKLKDMVEAAFPEEKCYEEATPSAFTRPCNLIVQDGCEVNVSMGTRLIEMRPTFTITTFAETDEYDNTHLAVLHGRQMRLLGLFLNGYIKVGDRAPKVEAVNLGGGYDYDTVTVTFSYTLSRQEFEATESIAMMEFLHINQEVKTHE